MDIKEEPLDSEDEIIDVPDLVELTSLENLKNESIEIKAEPIDLDCSDCHEKFTNEVALKIHKMLHSKTNYCFVCKKTLTLNFYKHVVNRHMNHACGICSKVFTLKKTLDDHIRSHTKDRIFKCDQCEKSFMQRGALKSHVTYAHKGIKPYACTVCSGTFTTSSSLKKHLRKMHSGNEVYECRICFKKFSDKKEKVDHEKKHTQGKVCEVCGKVFSSTDSISKHLVITHFRTEECIYCKKMFHKSLIDVHIVERHPQRFCDICNESFYDARLFYLHRMSHKEKIPCKQCGRYFTERYMERHRHFHLENRIQKCEICNHVYLNILKHKWLVHSKQIYYCEWCTEMFAAAKSKTRHIARVHLANSGVHPCNICKKKFKRLSTLQKHLAMHCRRRPYKCRMCKRGFKYLHVLETHKTRHFRKMAVKEKRPEERLTCDICRSVFSNKIKKRKHYVREHVFKDSVRVVSLEPQVSENCGNV